MIRVLPFALELALLVFCLIDCIQTDSLVVRNLNKGLWILLIIFVPLVGGIAWLVAGRPQRAARGRTVPWPSTRTAGFPEYERPRPVSPDDDPEFLAGLARADSEHEKVLRSWEDDLRRRAQGLSEGDADDDVPKDPGRT